MNETTILGLFAIDGPVWTAFLIFIRNTIWNYFKQFF